MTVLLTSRMPYFLFGLILTVILCGVTSKLSARYRKSRNLINVQNSHEGSISRFGGLTVVISTIAVFILFYPRSQFVDHESVFLVLIFSCAVFLIGFIEDIVGHIRPRFRILGVTVVAATAGFYLGWLDSVNIDVIDDLVAENYLLAATITVFGVVGLTNSFNLIDGLNGLCVGTTLVIVFVLIYLANVMELNRFVFFYTILFFCSVGFFICNFPYGKIFLGDGGAYFLGFAIAQGCILLNSAESPLSSWVFILVAIYPIWETIFSFSRRIIQGKKWSKADREHMHQRVYDFLRSRKQGGQSVGLNATASLICLIFPITSGALSIAYYGNSYALKLACLSLITVYMVIYVFLGKKLRELSIRSKTGS